MRLRRATTVLDDGAVGQPQERPDDDATSRPAEQPLEESAPAPEPVEPEPGPEPVAEAPDRRPGTLFLVAAGLALVGLVVLAVGGSSWYRASHDDSLDAARARDRAVVAASNEIATLNTLDYRHVDGGIRSWLAVTTGTLHDQLAQAGAQDKSVLAAQKKITTGKVVAAALTDLDAARGTATAIASVEITVRSTSGAPTLKRNRFSADLVLVKGRWLLESLTQVPVETS